MLESILIVPDNRFLTLSTYDFSLYGGQTPPALNFSAARASDAPSPSNNARGSHEPAVRGNADQHALIDDVAASYGSLDPSPAPAATSSSALAQPASLQGAGPAVTALPVDAAPLVPQPTGSGSVAPTQPQPQSTQSAPDAVTTALPQDAAATPQVSTLTTAVGDTLTQAGETIDPVVAGLANTLNTKGELASTTIDTVLPPVALVTDLGDTVNTTTQLASAAIDTVIAPVAAVGDAAVGVATDALATVEDDLTELAGSDPVGGVATLVSLVSVSDVFDVGEGEAHDSVTTMVPDLVNTLAADALPESPLLGDHDSSDDGGLLHTPVDDPLGLI